ncbi:MAG: hypothetical protein COW03_14530 [Cytophagales bacterium CG12_big_fil_rev_8_21_14_0_65_40_12]|nr:MAG: hypothetical protein COW03_14530 [Cytophagales bacterium CG12_big_fil_rev_8_21_14_0_65_40_12]PIW04144.1 MAG: hypothetical protein COW40_11715 [Cytophagales bacterium CG17_big_fil_post_rev_8_21_14_2_50_40_13]
MNIKQYLTPLIISGSIALIGAILNLILNWKELAYAEGWGVVGMIGILIYGSVAIITGFIIHLFSKKLKTRILIEVILIALVISYVLLFSGRF